MNVGIFDRFDRDEGDIVETTGVLQERSHLLFDKVESFLVPADSTHFGDDSDQFDDAQSFS